MNTLWCNFQRVWVLIAIAMLCLYPADAISQDALSDYISEEIGDFSGSSMNIDDEAMMARGQYTHPEFEDAIMLAVGYGDRAAEQYQGFQMMLFEGDPESIEADGLTFDFVEMQGNFMTFEYLDGMLISAAIQNPEEDQESAKEMLTAFYEALEPGRFANFVPPEDQEMEFTGEVNGATHCLDVDCFDEHIAQCEPAMFGGNLHRRLGVVYTVEEEAGNDRCRLSLKYTANPNSDWVDKPLYFNMARGDSFLDYGMDIVDECMGGSGEYGCDGPLLDEL